MKHLLICIATTLVLFQNTPAFAHQDVAFNQVQDLINHGNNPQTRILLRALLDRDSTTDLITALNNSIVEMNYTPETARILSGEYYAETGKLPLSENYILNLITGSERPDHIEGPQALLLALVTGRRDVETLSNVLVLSGYSNKKDGDGRKLAQMIAALQ